MKSLSEETQKGNDLKLRNAELIRELEEARDPSNLGVLYKAIYQTFNKELRNRVILHFLISGTNWSKLGKMENHKEVLDFNKMSQKKLDEMAESISWPTLDAKEFNKPLDDKREETDVKETYKKLQ